MTLQWLIKPVLSDDKKLNLITDQDYSKRLFLFFLLDNAQLSVYKFVHSAMGV